MIVPIAATFILAASVFEQTFDDGLNAYRAGDYAAAIQKFEDLIEQGVVNTAVFYNLGNAYYRAGHIGPAIANYERTLQLDPSLLDARENLMRAVSSTERRLSKPAPPMWEQSLLFWDDQLTQQTSYVLAGVCWVLGWTLLSIRLFWPFRYLLRGAVLAFVLTVIFAASVWSKANPQNIAVAAANRVPVHYGTHEDETVRFELYEGDRILVDRRTTAWARVITADGERGWAKAEQLAFVGPPYERITPRRDPSF